MDLLPTFASLAGIGLSQEVDGYDIRDYTPLDLPGTDTRHLFANTTLLGGTGEPLLRVLDNSRYRIWEWVSIERPVAGSQCNDGTGAKERSRDLFAGRRKRIRQKRHQQRQEHEGKAPDRCEIGLGVRGWAQKSFDLWSEPG